MSSRARTVLVTGVSSGIGRELVLECLARGHRVSGCARRAERLRELEAEATAAAGGRATGRLVLAAVDVNDPAATKAWMAAARASLGPIDALVLNAGYGHQGTVDALALEDFRSQFETNFFACVRMTQEVLPWLDQAGGGDLIYISSILGKLGLPGRSPYCASKFALEGFAESIRPELRPRGIRVSVVNPGFTATEFADSVKVRGPRPPRTIVAAMSARKVAGITADALGRERRNVILTGLGRLALVVRALAPWALERALVKNHQQTLASGSESEPKT